MPTVHQPVTNEKARGQVGMRQNRGSLDRSAAIHHAITLDRRKGTDGGAGPDGRSRADIGWTDDPYGSREIYAFPDPHVVANLRSRWSHRAGPGQGISDQFLPFPR